MRKILIALLSACLSLPALATTPGFTTVMATNVMDATGNALASGTATFQVVDAGARPLSVQLTGGGQIVTAPVSVQVTNGSFSTQVVDISQTSPSFPCVVLTITDNSTGAVVWQNNCIQPTGAVYDLDQFSTNVSPILPQAGDNVLGPLGVNGDLNITGNLTVGGFNPSLISSKSVNNVLNAALYGGSDIGAKVAGAFSTCTDAAPCHVYVPAGVYSFSTPILLPRRTNGNELTIDRNAALTYTGTGDAIGTQTMVNTWNLGGTLIDGGGLLIGTSAANSAIHIRPGQGYTVTDVGLRGFSGGDGIWVDGANVVTIKEVTSSFNLNGLRVTGNACNASNQCTWDRNSSHAWVNSGATGVTGFAPNALHVHDNRFIQNLNWGILEGDVIGGSVSQAFNNSYRDNDLEGNSTAGSSYGGALTGFSASTTFEGNYLEGLPRGIVVGCLNGEAGVATPSGYTAQFCGTAIKTTIQSNFFNDGSSTSEIYFAHASNPSVVSNDKHGSAPCLMDGGVVGQGAYFSGNAVEGGSAVCNSGTPGGPLLNYLEYGDTTLQAKHFGGSVQIDGVLTAFGVTNGDTGTTAFTSPEQVVGKMGPLIFWESANDPAGSCGSLPQTNTNIWFSPQGMSVCQNGIWAKVGH